MPNSTLFAINNEGRVFSLSTNGSKWREFPYPGIDFKHISAVPHYLWAIGSDRQVYLLVHSLDTAIRVKEESFENQRWLPLEGFSDRLLPTDRHGFSSEDGLTERRKDKIRVPSMAWKWESDWKIDTVFDNEPLDHDGWTYAVDFPATYCSSKKWNSCVRRRKWVRYRRYIAINSWCSISPLHSDPTQEPFRDISIGGQNLLGAPSGSLQVWGVTVHGRVMWRKGVRWECPEGVAWNEIPLPAGVEIKQISCGPDDQVWAITTQGIPLIRLGISAATPTGEKWFELQGPPDDGTMKQIVVASRSVWALTDDGSVWFRKGGSEMSHFDSEGWVHMVGFMEALSISPADQLFGIGLCDRNLYIRYGVTDAELTGKRWKQIQAPVQDSKGSSETSLNNPSPMSLINEYCQSTENGFVETSRSAPTSLKINERWSHPSEPPMRPDSLPTSAPLHHVEVSAVQDSVNQDKDTLNGRHHNLSAWSPVRSVGSLLGLEANPDIDPNADWDGEIFNERESSYDNGWNQIATMWTYVAAGGLVIDPSHLPNWFSDSGYSSCLEMFKWRCKILEDLQSSNLKKITGFEKYEPAIERTASSKSVDVKFLLPGGNSYEDGILEVEWTTNHNNCIEDGTLTILSVERNVTHYQVLLSEVLCIVSSSEPGCPQLAVHTTDSPMTTSNLPLVIQFISDVEYDDWHAQLTAVVCGFHKLDGRPNRTSIWATTRLGDVFVFDPYTMQKSQLEDDIFCKDLSYKHKSRPWSHILSNGFSEDGSVSVMCSIPDDPLRFTINFECDSDKKIALHFNVRFDDKTIVRNTKVDDCWGNEEKEGSFCFKPNSNYIIDIFCQKEGFKISIDGIMFCYFEHRIKPELICNLSINGTVHIQKVLYRSSKVMISAIEMIWREMGGHMALVESCSSGVVWGLSFDNTPFIYTGGWGGTFLSGYESCSVGLHPLTDSLTFYIYENQRWNPLSGFTSRGLPTDRPMWSDSTGRIKRSKETTRVLNMHWQWISEWSIDFATPGGVDSDGWQYATDFPASYHSRKTLTDYVRRRRWSRRCKLTDSGPWQEVGNSKLIDISIHQCSAVDTICVWAIGLNGDVMFRKGVTAANPMGDTWEQVSCDHTLQYISCGFGNQVWAVSKKGLAIWRFGITTSNPIGHNWETVESPNGVTLRKISVARWCVWALDTEGCLHIRHDVSPVFPEGSHWQSLSLPETYIDISTSHDEVWAINSQGVLCHRIGISSINPAGQLWDYGINANWKTISCRGFIVK